MSTLHALVIGVDRHDPSRGRDNLMIPDLAGAVADALRVERYLREGPRAVPRERIRTLISPSRFSRVPQPAPEDLPTYANVMQALSDLQETAERGDQILVHFSGHGMRVPSLEAVKGPRGWDEALVPCDAGSGGVIRDVEMYHQLSRLAGAGVFVTVLLDACHGGGATRSFPCAPEARDGFEQERVRGLGERRGDWGPFESPCGPWDALYRAARASQREETRPGYRHFGSESGWFPQPQGCVLLAACREIELAREKAWGADGVSGAFTHSLLEGLRSLGEEVSYGALLGAVQRRIQSIWRSQTPILEGDGDLQFLGAGRRAKPAASPGLAKERRVLCRVGFDANPGQQPPELVHLSDLLRSDAASAAASRVELVLDETGRAELCLGVVEGAAVEVRDPFGTPLPGVGAPVPLAAADAAPALAGRLEHLALFHRVRDLAPPSESPLRGALRLGLFRIETKDEWFDPSAREPVRGDRLPTGWLLCLLVRNTSEHPLNAVVLDLRPDWAIERVHPPEGDREAAVIEPGADQPVFLNTWLPDGVSEARSLLKVIASVAPITADGYVLPVLGNGAKPVRSIATASPEGDLWTTAEMEITVFG